MSQSETNPLNPIEEVSETEDNELSEVKDNSMGEFYEMRNSLFLGTVIVALVGSLITGLLYSWQSSLNYLLGTGVGLVYLNMLAKAVERVGEKKKSVGMNRLLLFVGLMIVAIKIQALEVVPIFIGFITYKVTILFYILPLNLLGERKKIRTKNLKL